MADLQSTVKVNESGGIHTLTLNRPDRRNALNPQMIRELIEALNEAEQCACEVVILTGAGTAFCSGMDLEHLRSLEHQLPEDQRADIESFMWLMRRLYEVTKPTIAAVNGAALAGGNGLAMQCDFTLAATSAKFGYTEARIGYIPAVVSVFLTEIVGEKRARDLLLSGRILSSDEALALGLLAEVTSEAELMPRCRALAATLMRNSPESMRETKRLLLSFSKERLDLHLRWAIRSSERARNQEDFHEGVQAFLEKRDPVWPSRKRK